jgi:hypothetical protein
MKNILFHSGEFWFNEKGFPEKPHLSDFPYHNRADALKKANADYEHAPQLALSDTVKFEDQEAIRIAICELQPNKGMGYYQFEPVEGQTFFIEGATTKFIYENNKTFGGRGTTQVAILSNSPVKSETPKSEGAERLEGAYLNKIIEVIDYLNGNLLGMPSAIKAIRALAKEGLGRRSPIQERRGGLKKP